MAGKEIANDDSKLAEAFRQALASSDGLELLSGVRADIEALGYGVGGADLCSPWQAAPHLRQRLYFGAVRMADTDNNPGRAEYVNEQGQRKSAEDHTAERSRLSRLADSEYNDWKRRIAELPGSSDATQGTGVSDESGRCSDSGWLGHTIIERLEGHSGNVTDGDESGRIDTDPHGSVATTGAWAGAEIIHCLDGKCRRFESGAFPLAPGLPRKVGHLQSDVRKLVPGARRNRKGRLVMYGNSIVPQVGAAFIKAFMESVELLKAGPAQ